MSCTAYLTVGSPVSQARCRGFDPRLPLHQFSAGIRPYSWWFRPVGASRLVGQTCLTVLRKYLRASLSASLVVLAGCSNPTAPTAEPVRSSLRDDPRFDAGFYQQFVGTSATNRQRFTIYVNDVDNLKQPVPPDVVARAKDAAASLQQSLGQPVDVRDRRTAAPGDTLQGLSVLFIDGTNGSIGGFAAPLLAGAAYIYHQASSFENCGGLSQTVVRHELLHAMGFAHVDGLSDVLYHELRYCDLLPSPREQFHFQVAMQERGR